MQAEGSLNIHTDLFHAVIEIARCGSISHAANNLFVSQPNLSAQIRSLEKDLGYPIFLRSNTGVTLTEQGKLFVDSASIIVSEMNNIQTIPQRVTPVDENLSIVCVYSVHILDRYLNFRRAFPQNNTNDLFKETGLQSALDDMMKKRYRLGFIYQLEEREDELEDLAQRYLLDFQLMTPNIPILAIVPKSHPLAHVETIPLEVLANTPLVAFEYLKDGNWLEAMGLPNPKDVLYVFDRGGKLEVISHGHHVGVSIGSPFADVENDEVSCIPVTGVKSKVNQYLVKEKSLVLSKTENQFLRYLTAES